MQKSTDFLLFLFGKILLENYVTYSKNCMILLPGNQWYEYGPENSPQGIFIAIS
jgi:hypothetical protein